MAGGEGDEGLEIDGERIGSVGLWFSIFDVARLLGTGWRRVAHMARSGAFGRLRDQDRCISRANLVRFLTIQTSKDSLSAVDQPLFRALIFDKHIAGPPLWSSFADVARLLGMGRRRVAQIAQSGMMGQLRGREHCISRASLVRFLIFHTTKYDLAAVHQNQFRDLLFGQGKGGKRVF